ncbi:MAG: hypothetical protein GPOALKHO_001930 [Sodalis sp.]|nr:MAG: hypothetical protein GPOALKHO_001930 [Sodalis sp.]
MALEQSGGFDPATLLETHIASAGQTLRQRRPAHLGNLLSEPPGALRL